MESGVPFGSGQLHNAFIACSSISIAVLAVMLISLIGLWLRPQGPSLPRTPNTVAAMCSYIYGARMLEDFAGLACEGTETRNPIVRDWGREYVLALGRGGGWDAEMGG